MRILSQISLVLLIGLATSSQAKPIRIAVASNFQQTLERLRTSFLEANPDQEIQIIPGSTGKLYLQVLNGAPYDIFFAADSERPRLLEDAGLLQAEGRFPFALGILALWANNDSLVEEPGDKWLRRSNFRKLAIANPQVAPFGAASIEMLESIGLYETLKPKLVFGENVSQPFHYANSGVAECAFISYASLLALKDDRGSFWLPPADSYSPIIQEVVLLSSSKEARYFFEFVRSSAAASIIENAGYRLP